MSGYISNRVTESKFNLSSNSWMKIKVIENSSNKNFYFGQHVPVRDMITIKERQRKPYTPPMFLFNFTHVKDSVMVFWSNDIEYDIFLHNLGLISYRRN